MTYQINLLPNGLRIAVDEMKDVETVSIGVFVKTGSRNEIIKNNGISHFLEHMAFKGTTNRSAKKIAEDFEDIGGRINAYTSREKTVYYAKVLKQHAKFAVEFLADILQNSTFDEVELEKERGVILQEIAMTNDTPDDIVFDYFQEAAYPNQAIGRSILGPDKNIKKFTKNNFVEYIESQYNYSNIVISAAGNIKSQDLVDWSEKYFSKLGVGNVKPSQAAEYKGGVFTKNKKLEQVNIVYGFPSISYIDDEYYTSQLLATILGGGMSSRLFQEIRENRGLAYSIYAFNQSYQDCGTFGIYAATSKDKTKELLDATKKEIDSICQKTTQEELERAKTQFKASLLMAKESTSSRMQRLGSDLLLIDRVVDDVEFMEKITKITSSDISAFAKKIFNGNNPTLAAIGEVKDLGLGV